MWDDCNNCLRPSRWEHVAQGQGRQVQNAPGQGGAGQQKFILFILLPTCHFREPSRRRGAVVRWLREYLFLGWEGYHFHHGPWQVFIRTCFWMKCWWSAAHHRGEIAGLEGPPISRTAVGWLGPAPHFAGLDALHLPPHVILTTALWVGILIPISYWYSERKKDVKEFEYFPISWQMLLPWIPQCPITAWDLTGALIKPTTEAWTPGTSGSLWVTPQGHGQYLSHISG